MIETDIGITGVETIMTGGTIIVTAIEAIGDVATMIDGTITVDATLVATTTVITTIGGAIVIGPISTVLL